jgi:prepilin-type N-terminal cleavage/methylation domain-containing protein
MDRTGSMGLAETGMRPPCAHGRCGAPLPRERRCASPGFSLVELLVVVVLAGLMLGGVYQTLIVQQQSYRQQNAVTNARQASRAVLEILAAELREVSPVEGDILYAGADSIRFRAYRKVGVVCAVSAGAHLHVWELGEPFAAADSIAVFADGDPASAADDGWVVGEVSSVNASSGTCPAWGSYPTRQLIAPAAATNAVLNGAPVRAFEPYTYGLYQDGGEWVLGRRGRNNVVAPLIGPLASAPEGGLQFRYFRADGTELPRPLSAADRLLVSRIEILVRGIGHGAADPVQGDHVDSLVVQVHVRG